MSADPYHVPFATVARSDIPLSWARRDIEQRIGFHGGRFTRASNLLTCLIALVLTAAFYTALIPLQGTYFGDMFTQRGPTQYPTVFLSFWSLAILFIKWRKLALQRQALTYQIVPTEHDFVLSSTTVEQVTQRIHATVDDPRCFVLFNRIAIALSNLRNLGQVTEVDSILNSLAEQDEDSLETSYSLISGFIWAIPVLGFIGTVLGLSEAISAFGAVLGDVTELSQITTALKGVTAGLSTAFETTLAALVAAMFVQLGLTYLKTREQEFLEDCSEYCLRNVVSRLRILPFEAPVDE
jgi:biopolymer transport protein ExbB/TolQ